MKRSDNKRDEIEEYIEELREILPKSFDEYIADFKLRAACERYFEKIIEGVVDMAFMIIKENNFKIPEEDKKAFDILAEQNLISDKTCEKLKDAKGMRNIIAHEYGVIDNKLVFHAITEELIKDAEIFLKETNGEKRRF